jgi:serine/threonine protein kinase
MGKGGMATVYRAADNSDGTIVAIKIFQTSPERSADLSRKLRDREVRMLVSVQHPNIVKYRTSGEVGDNFFYAMEFVENSLLKRMRSGSDFDLVDKVLILRQTAEALGAIHHQGIVHRDVKPGNILLDQDPNGAIHVKLTDLGIAKNVSETVGPCAGDRQVPLAGTGPAAGRGRAVGRLRPRRGGLRAAHR